MLKQIIVDVYRGPEINRMNSVALLLWEGSDGKPHTSFVGVWSSTHFRKIAEAIVEAIKDKNVGQLIIDKKGLGSGLWDSVETLLEKEGFELDEKGFIAEKLIATKKQMEAEYMRGYKQAQRDMGFTS